MESINNKYTPFSETNAAHLQCKRPYLFERFVNTALNVVDNYKTVNGVIIEDCLVICAADFRCKSINFNRKTRMCMLSDQDRSNISLSLIEISEEDYYENNCNKGEYPISLLHAYSMPLAHLHAYIFESF